MVLSSVVCSVEFVSASDVEYSRGVMWCERFMVVLSQGEYC